MDHPTRPALLVVAFFFIVLSCHAQTDFPDTPSGKQAKGWLAVFNTGDAGKYKEFVEANFPARVQRAIRIRDFAR